MIVTVVWATRHVQDIVPVELPRGATVADALLNSGLVAHYGLDMALLGFARFGARVDADTPLIDGDRVEIVRGLVADPKTARARRAHAKPDAPVKRRNVRSAE